MGDFIKNGFLRPNIKALKTDNISLFFKGVCPVSNVYQQFLNVKTGAQNES